MGQMGLYCCKQNYFHENDLVTNIDNKEAFNTVLSIDENNLEGSIKRDKESVIYTPSGLIAKENVEISFGNETIESFRRKL